MSLDDPASLPPLLLPRPRHLELGGLALVDVPATITARGVEAELLASTLGPEARAVPDPEAWLWCLVGPEIGGSEHYILTIAPRAGAGQCVGLIASDAAGLRHGLSTLAQLLVQYGARLPELRIDDQPAFAVRGAMLDVSRDRVPTMEHLLATVDQLASWKINHLQLYTEHTFAYAGHEEVWRDASPLTPDEVRALDRHCRARGVALAANQNCFGHLASWLSRPAYAPLAEVRPGETWDFNGLVTRSGPFSLCPGEPRALDLVRDLLGQLLPCFSSGLVNIGCDETFDVGQGRSRAAVAERGRAAVYLDFVDQVCAIARGLGARPMFWADIALEHPEALARLPADLVCLAWGYEPDAPFARWCAQCRAAGREVWVCPGTSAWRSLAGRTTERRANLLAAARDGLAHGASGWLATDWGDLGHRQQWPVTLHALAEAAHRAWSGTADYDGRAGSLHAFADRSLSIGAWLDALGDADLDLRRTSGKPGPEGAPRPLRNASALFTDLTRPMAEPGPGTLAEWETVLARINDLSRPGWFTGRWAGLAPLLLQELRLTARAAQFAAWRGVVRRMPGLSLERSRALAGDLATALRPIIADHRALWLARSRPGGLAASCAHYQTVLRELLPTPG